LSCNTSSFEICKEISKLWPLLFRLSFVIEGYLDASWITDEVEYASMLGWVYLLGGGAVSWASKKQTYIIYSTMAIELVPLATTNKEVK